MGGKAAGCGVWGSIGDMWGDWVRERTRAGSSNAVCDIWRRTGLRHLGTTVRESTWKLPIACRCRVAVPEKHVVKPLRDGEGRRHQLPDGVEYRLEVVLLWLPAHEHVERLVHVLPRAVRHRLRVEVVLRRVEQQLELARRAAQLLVLLALAREDVALLVAHLPSTVWTGGKSGGYDIEEETETMCFWVFFWCCSGVFWCIFSPARPPRHAHRRARSVRGKGASRRVSRRRVSPRGS